jgi:hypothetical protein
MIHRLTRLKFLGLRRSNGKRTSAGVCYEEIAGERDIC